ncbi:hypothetical protein DFQ26_002902 [Actinomortierella ambigua]|nr:hypothetical protein DFQ26_002902 [Actinomortierella ambigua]
MTTIHRSKRLRTGLIVQSLQHDSRNQLSDGMEIDNDEEDQARVRRRRLSSVLRRQDLAEVLPVEVTLQVFEKLAPADLGRCAVVSRLWIMRIGMDRHLAASRRRRSTSTSRERAMSMTTSSTLEWVARSLEEEEELPNYATCWKALYKLNYNWLMGQPVVTCLSLDDIKRQDLLWRKMAVSQEAGSGRLERTDLSKEPSVCSIPLVQFTGSILATAINTPCGPRVHFWRLVRGGSSHQDDAGAASNEDAAHHRLNIEYCQTFECPKPPKSKDSNSRRTIVTFELDRSLARCKSSQQSSILAMVGYDTGDFTIFEINVISPITIREIGTWNSDVVGEKNSKLQSSCFRYPMVVTYCTSGTLSIFKVSSAAERAASSSSTWCRLLHRMHGQVGESPVEMEVEEVAKQQQQQQQQQKSGATRWHVRLAFGVPLLDGFWTVRLQEIELDDYRILDCGEIGSGSYRRHRPKNPAAAFAGWGGLSSKPGDLHRQDFEMNGDGDEGMDDEETEYLRESHSLATVAPIASISLASPYLVTTHRDNTMNVFRIQRRRRQQQQQPWAKASSSVPPQSNTMSTINRLEFWHMSTLYGHCGAVSSASIDARLGRLVSASMDRSVKIWRIGKSDGHDEDHSTPMHRYYHHKDHQRLPVPSASDIAQAMEQGAENTARGHGDAYEPWPFGDEYDVEDYDPDCLVSMSVNDNSWVRSKKINHDEGVGLAWIGSDEEKIVSVSLDGMIRVWRFT